MKHSEKTFQILDTLDRQEISSQRQLADHSGISLGQVNYLIRSLLKKGLIKIGNFRKSPYKIGYAYLLTPKGIEAKSRLAVQFVIHKLREYDKLRERLAERLRLIEEKGHSRLIFIGPAIVKEFIDSVIQERQFTITFVGHCNEVRDLHTIDPDSYDVVLIFDENLSEIRLLKDDLEVSPEKLLSLW